MLSNSVKVGLVVNRFLEEIQNDIPPSAVDNVKQKLTKLLEEEVAFPELSGAEHDVPWDVEERQCHSHQGGAAC